MPSFTFVRHSTKQQRYLQSKHPMGPLPTPPAITSPSAIFVPVDFNIMAILQSFPMSMVCRPLGLRIQHLLEAAEIPLQFPICSSLRDIFNLLASGKVPALVSKYLVGGSLVALAKNKPHFPPDIRPIVVGEALRRLVGNVFVHWKWLRLVSFLAPCQFAVACPSGAEKVIHDSWT